MANSVHRDRQGPDWPLGNIAVVTPGTPVSIMSLVDAAGADDPSAPTSSTSGEYTAAAQQIIFQAIKAGAGPPLISAAANTGFIYIVRKPTAGGGGTGDTGVIVKALAPGETWVLGSSALVRNVFNPYRYFVDGDTAGNGCQVTLIIQ